MSKTIGLFEKLSNSSHAETKELCEEARKLYMRALNGNLSARDIENYIKENRLIERIPESDHKDYKDLLDLIIMIGLAQ